MNSYKIKRIVLFLFILIYVRSAFAGTDINSLLVEVMNNYYDAKFESAITKGKEAVLELEGKNLETVYKILGFSFISINKENEGIFYLKAALRINPDISLDPMEPSAFHLAVDKAKEQIKIETISEKPVSLDINNYCKY